MFSVSEPQKRGLKGRVSWGKGVGCELREVRTPWASVDYYNDVDFL